MQGLLEMRLGGYNTRVVGCSRGRTSEAPVPSGSVIAALTASCFKALNAGLALLWVYSAIKHLKGKLS